MGEKEPKFYDVWGDNVELRDLLLSMVISIVGTLGGYLVAPDEPPIPLVFGLVGGIIGFIICSIIIKPKRHITIEEEVTE